MKLQADGPYRFRLDPKGEMRVPGVVFASDALLRDADKAIDQVANVATLPGIVGASYAMPDIHWGYGFAIGGVAATDPAEGGVVSPGGGGFDISCGGRLLAGDPIAGETTAAAEAFGLRNGQVCVMIHCGSRGLGHQICTDHVRTMDKRMPKYGIKVPDRQLACAPVDSAAGRAYLGAMAAAANYGRANRQLLAQAARRVFDRVAGARLDLVYDVSHNLAKIEEHVVDGARRRLCVHRKGATRAFPPGHPELPADLRAVGQPVLIPGTMGTSSYVLTGVANGPAFHSTCHGAGRAQSRHQAARGVSGRLLRDAMEADGIAVRASSWRGLAEEHPDAYKDVSAVIEASEGAGLCRKVARLLPMGVV